MQLVQIARANAALEDRTYVTPDDIKKLAGVALAHRMRLDRSAALKGLATDTSMVVQQVSGCSETSQVKLSSQRQRLPEGFVSMERSFLRFLTCD